MRGKHILILGVSGITLTLIVFFAVLDNWFLGDDLAWLAQAKTSRSLWTMLTTTPWDGYLRPVFHTLLWVQWKLFRTAPLPYHAVSVLLHVMSGLLLTCLVWLVSSRKAISILSGGLFLVVSAGSEAVYWISAQSVLLTVFFLEASLCLWIVHISSKKKYLGVLSLFSYILALGAMASAVLGLPLLIWLALKRGRTKIAIVTTILTLLYFCAYAFLNPELSVRVLDVVSASGIPWSFGRSWLEAYSRMIDPAGGRPWAGVLLVVVSYLIVRNWRLVSSLHWLIFLSIAPYAVTLMRHQGPGSTLPFDRYYYVARPALSVLIAVVLMILVGQLKRCAKHRIFVLALGILTIFWASEQVKFGRRMDIIYGESSLRLKDAVEEIASLDPGPPVRLVLKGLAVPDGWSIPSVGKVFFRGRLRREEAVGKAKIRIFRDRDGKLVSKRYLEMPRESEGEDRSEAVPRPPRD